MDTIEHSKDHSPGATRTCLHCAGIIWLTGLSGAGKSTIAEALRTRLVEAGRHVLILDGDVLRRGLNADLGFSAKDRSENIRRVAHVARLMADAGMIVIVALISPFRAERQLAREVAGTIPFMEVYVDTPIGLCEQRDPKGLYRKARAGLLPDFTGIDSPYEPPEHPELRLDTSSVTVLGATTAILQTMGLLDEALQ